MVVIGKNIFSPSVYRHKVSITDRIRISHMARDESLHCPSLCVHPFWVYFIRDTGKMYKDEIIDLDLVFNIKLEKSSRKVERDTFF